MKSRIRGYLRRLWESRGGGFYGFVAALTFLYLEALDLISDFARIGEAELFDFVWWVQWLVGNMVDAITNTVYGAIWPAIWIQRFGVGVTMLVVLGVSYGAYLLIRPGVMRMLSEPADPKLESTR